MLWQHLLWRKAGHVGDLLLLLLGYLGDLLGEGWHGGHLPGLQLGQVVPVVQAGQVVVGLESCQEGEAVVARWLPRLPDHRTPEQRGGHLIESTTITRCVLVSELKVMELMVMMFFISPEVAVVAGRVCTAFLTWPGQPSPGSQTQPKRIRN